MHCALPQLSALPSFKRCCLQELVTVGQHFAPNTANMHPVLAHISPSPGVTGSAPSYSQAEAVPLGDAVEACSVMAHGRVSAHCDEMKSTQEFVGLNMPVSPAAESFDEQNAAHSASPTPPPLPPRRNSQALLTATGPATAAVVSRDDSADLG